ncbi:MAG: RNA polymerase sigma factor [Kofleriaceae bacterium]
MKPGPPGQPDARADVDDLTLRRAQRGDALALRRLLETHLGTLHALVWRLAGPARRADVDDLVQDSLIRIVGALPRFDPAGPARLSTWMLTIATRVVLNAARRPLPGALPDEDAGGDPDLLPSAQLERRQLGAALAAAVAALPADQRAVLVLRDYHDLDYTEIAAALELELGTVKSRLCRARQAVRAELERRLPECVGGAR